MPTVKGKGNEFRKRQINNNIRKGLVWDWIVYRLVGTR